MRTRTLLALAGLLATLTLPAAPAADSPDALLSPLVPAAKHARVRLPVAELDKGNAGLRIELPHGKNKGEVVVATAALDSGRGRSYVTAEALARWGYEVKKGDKTVTLRDLWLLGGVQAAPAPTAKQPGRDAAVRLPSVVLAVAHNAGDNGVYGFDLSLANPALYPGQTTAERAPRLAFADGFLELTVPDARVRRPGTSDAKVPEVTAADARGLVPVIFPTAPGSERLMYAAVNGVVGYKPTPQCPPFPIEVVVSSQCNWGTGLTITAGLARKCKVEYDTKDRQTGVFVDGKENSFARATVKELRLGCYTDAALKKPVDLVLTDVPVMVDLGESGVYAFVGAKFFAAHVKDAVYAAGADGLWKLYGRCDKNALANVANRPKP